MVRAYCGKTKGVAAVAALLLALAIGPVASAQVSASDGAAYIGAWTLNIDFNGQEFSVTMTVMDKDGQLAGTVSSPLGGEPSEITSFELTDGELKAGYEADFGGTTMVMNIAGKLEDGAFNGTFGDTGGLFSADFKGSKSEVSASAETEDRERAAARRARRRGAGGRTKLELNEKEINISYGQLKNDSTDYELYTKVGEGEIFKFTTSRATKLMTHTDLHFGSTIIKYGNAADDYPGVYSLWLKKSGDTWNLVFNEHADIWGTQHVTTADVAEVPLTHSMAAEASDQIKIELKEDGANGGTLNFTWGSDTYSAKFTVQ